MEYVGFDSMRDVVEHLKSGKPLYYQAPLNYRPVRVDHMARPFGKERVFILPTNRYERDGNDPFTADAGHLDRFKRPA